MSATGATSTEPVNVSERKEIARLLLDSGTEAIDLELEPVIDQEAGLLAALSIPFPDGLAPEPQPIDPAPDRNAPLPPADVVVVTWTVAELNALADVLTPGTPAHALVPLHAPLRGQVPAADPRGRTGSRRRSGWRASSRPRSATRRSSA